jgi:hypothetical protein
MRKASRRINSSGRAGCIERAAGSFHLRLAFILTMPFIEPMVNLPILSNAGGSNRSLQRDFHLAIVARTPFDFGFISIPQR